MHKIIVAKIRIDSKHSQSGAQTAKFNYKTIISCPSNEQCSASDKIFDQQLHALKNYQEKVCFCLLS